MTEKTLAEQIAYLFSEHFGIAPEELNMETDLVEDVDVKGDLESLARFFQSINATFETEIRLPTIIEGLEDDSITTLQDIVNVIEDAMLE